VDPSAGTRRRGSGAVLVDGAGRTLYVNIDELSNPKACNAECTAAWPPLIEGSAPPVLHNGVARSLVGTRTIGGERTVVTYGGYVLHTYAGDDQPGQDNGENVQSVWYTIAASGKPTRSGG
jgi:predicted lipoprotein with Yx(FWY)xxD motif